MEIDKKRIIIAATLTLIIEGCSSSSVDIKEAFESAVPLLCSTSLHEYGEEAFVTKEGGWSIYKEKFFKKGDRVVYMKSCKRADSIE